MRLGRCDQVVAAMPGWSSVEHLEPLPTRGERSARAFGRDSDTIPCVPGDATEAELSPVASPRSTVELRTLRRLLLIGFATYLLWWFAVQALLPGSYNPLGTRMLVVAYFGLAWGASFARGMKIKTVERSLTVGVWLLTGHYFYLIHGNSGAMAWAVGAYIVVIAAGACLRSRGAQLAYSLSSMAVAVFVALYDPVLLRSIFLPGLATMLMVTNFTWHTRFLLEAERAERLIADARRSAAEANVAAREEFIAIASHELYTPLTALQLTIQSLSSRLTRDDAELRRENVLERLERCQAHVNRLIRLVDEVLNTSRVEALAPALRLAPVRLLALARDVAGLFSGAGANERTPIEVVGDDSLEVWCDRLRMEQVVTNLVRNALMFGAGEPVRVAVEAFDGGARLRVSDRGIGVAPADHARIFGRFERAVSSAHYGGMGLGLYIAKQVVDAHGGRIGVESALGQGATFTVELLNGRSGSDPKPAVARS
jgi:signal transduction histidine kinase